MKYDHRGKINGDYFRIIKNGKIENLSDFNINYKDYIIIKVTNKQRLVCLKDFLEFKYSGYFFIKKDLFNEDDFNFWLKSDFEIRFLNKPLP